MAVQTGIEPAISSVTGKRIKPLYHWTVVAEIGFEPMTFGLWAQRAADCSTPLYMAGNEGFEPPRAVKPLLVFKTSPFSQAWVITLVDPTGFEPVTNRLWAGCSNRWAMGPTTLVFHMVASVRVELTTFRVWTGCSNQLSYNAKWWRIWDSNPPPPACKAGALAKWANPPKWWRRQDLNLRPLRPKRSALPSWATSPSSVFAFFLMYGYIQKSIYIIIHKTIM